MVTLEPGSQFGKYRIQEVIGRGGMGVVYVAEDTSLGRRVALKVLSPDLVSSSAFEQRFRQEARIVASLNHPNIVQIHSLERIEDRLVIDMMYIEGGSLADAEASGRATLAQTLHSVGDALAGLASCHQVGVVHRDVKPSNILLSGQGTALVSDFGLSKCLAAHQEMAMSSMASSCLFLGTPRYAPPESWEGVEPTPAWDVYSAGAVLYEAVAGRAPHEANSPLKLIRSFYEDAVPRLSDLNQAISPILSDGVAQMLAASPEERPQDASAALKLLSEAPEYAAEEIAKGSTIVRVKWPATAQRKRLRFAKLKVPLAIFAVLALAGAVGGLSLLSAQFSGGNPQPRPASNCYVFNTTDALTNERWSAHWLMTRLEGEETWQILASKGTDVLYIQAGQDGETFDLQGQWAHYTDKTARAFRHGSVKGTGNWVRQNELMTVTLQFECSLDGSRWQDAFLLERRGVDEVPEQFVADLESVPLVSRLIYCELMPRNLEWAEEVENRFIARGVSKVTVPFVTASGPPMNVDGRADEAVWQRAAVNGTADSGVLMAHPQAGKASLTVCRDQDQLYVLCTFPAALEKPELTLQLLTRFDTLPQQAESWKLSVEQSGAACLYKVVGGREYPQDAQVKVALLPGATRHEMEIGVPFAALEITQPPLPAGRWRLSATLADAQEEANHGMYWGRTPGTPPVHGAILQFGPSL